jgi:predicted enzyme related to lactoylglutathione lyase
MGEQPYPMIMNAGQGIGGFRTAEPRMPSHWASYLSVESVDRSVAAAQQAGAHVLMPPTDFGPVGRGAAVADPAGAAIALWRGAGDDRPDSMEGVPVGDWYWVECMTGDAEKALAFYEKVFGFTHDTMNMGPTPYYVLKTGDVPRAGIMKSPDPNAHPAWLPYVSVADCDAALAKATSLGAQVCVPAMDIPDVGRFGVFMDPLGAALGVIRGKSTLA